MVPELNHYPICRFLQCQYCDQRVENQLMLYCHCYVYHDDIVKTEWIPCKNCSQYFPTVIDLSNLEKSCSNLSRVKEENDDDDDSHSDG